MRASAMSSTRYKFCILWVKTVFFKTYRQVMQRDQIMDSIKPPNEKLTEMLFVRYAFQVLSNESTLYAPSTREEAEIGYDANFMDSRGCFELLLQFKAPRPNKDT